MLAVVWFPWMCVCVWSRRSASRWWPPLMLWPSRVCSRPPRTTAPWPAAATAAPATPPSSPSALQVSAVIIAFNNLTGGTGQFEHVCVCVCVCSPRDEPECGGHLCAGGSQRSSHQSAGAFPAGVTQETHGAEPVRNRNELTPTDSRQHVRFFIIYICRLWLNRWKNRKKWSM